MKVKLVSGFFEQIRLLISQSSTNLQKNKTLRKQLIVQIREMKNNIRAGERLCSKLEVGLVVETDYIRDDLKKKRDVLNDLRANLVSQEINHSVELAKFRTLHQQLDKMRVPFDPEAFAKARSK